MKKIRETIDRKSFKPVKLSYKKAIRFVKKKEVFVADRYSESLGEIFLLKNPKYRFNKEYRRDFEKFVKEHCKGKPMEEMGNWFYFPWSGRLVHFLPEKLHQEVRTGRNRNLITASEQEKYYNAVVGILGMSVGSQVALTIAMTGGSKRIKLADPDSIDASNLNRIRTGFQDAGTPKVISVARQIYEMNPYAKVEIFKEGATESNIEKFIFSPKLEDFKNISPKDLPKVIAKMAGANLAVPRMLESVLEVGKSLYSWPQLGTAATTCGVGLRYLARKIIIGDELDSGRYEVNFDSIFEPGYHSTKSKTARAAAFKKFLKKIKNS